MVDLIIMMTVLSYEGRCLKVIVDTGINLDGRGKQNYYFSNFSMKA